MWTCFMDMHSGGRAKEGPFEYILIEAPQQEAEIIFYNRFGHNPNRVSCTCCGEDYSISTDESLEQLTAFDRGCFYDGKRYLEKQDTEYRWKEYMPLEQYLKNKNVLTIRAEDIRKEERQGIVPKQGYVWVE